MPTAIQIKIIHTLKGALSLDDDAYRSVLSQYGVDSSTSLSETKAAKLIADLEGKASAAGVWKKKRRDSGDADAMTRKIRALWFELYRAGKVNHNNDKAMAAYVKRMTGRDSIRWCTYVQKNIIIEALKKWLDR